MFAYASDRILWRLNAGHTALYCKSRRLWLTEYILEYICYNLFLVCQGVCLPYPLSIFTRINLSLLFIYLNLFLTTTYMYSAAKELTTSNVFSSFDNEFETYKIAISLLLCILFLVACYMCYIPSVFRLITLQLQLQLRYSPTTCSITR